MFKLRLGYLISGIATGCLLMISLAVTIPDGKLHIVFCDVGQGDAIYIKFPDGRDMLIDGGPNDSVLACLGRHMPFWDRTIDIVALSHPQKDHMAGLVSVLQRYTVLRIMRSDIVADSDVYKKFITGIAERKIPVEYVVTGDTVGIGSTTLSLLWPSTAQIVKGARASVAMNKAGNVLGAAIDKELNDYCLVFTLHYGSFDAVFAGDADIHVEHNYVNAKLSDDAIEVLKVPHHGSKTGMTKDFVNWIRPQFAVISVGKNSYGHPSKEVMEMLESVAAVVRRTDEIGDIEVVSDGDNWSYQDAD